MFPTWRPPIQRSPPRASPRGGVQALGKTVTSGRTQLLLGTLSAKGVVRQVAPEWRPQGGRPSQLWKVNPALASA
jgi:hypothetical protein